MGTKIRVADYIAKRCVEAGAKHVFLVTGGGAMHLNDAFGRNKNLDIVCFHHEQAAAMAAESYYRISNRLAVLNVTTGPGGINALNGVYGAYVDSLGMIVISGQVKNETYLGNYSLPLRQLGDQEVNITAIARPIVKYATVLKEPNNVRKIMDKAIFIANNGRPGPVWVDVPVDIQGKIIDIELLEPFDFEGDDLVNDPDVPDNTRLELISKKRKSFSELNEKIIRKLLKSKRPVVFAGSGVRISGKHKEFLRILDKIQVPVVTGWNAHDTLTNDSPYYSGRPGTVGDRAGNFTVQNSDFLLILGCRLNIRQISYNWKSFATKAWKVMVDIDQSELDKPTLSIDLKINANLQDFIPELEIALKNYESLKEHKKYLNWCRKRVANYPVVLPEYANDDLINPYYFIQYLFSKLKNTDIVVAANGSACVMGFQAAYLKKGQRFYTNSGSASMGYDLPAAIGASIAMNKKRVFCLAGDGSLMMNLQELQTLIGYNLPVKLIVLNNNGYHSIRQTQEAYFSDNIVGVNSNSGVSLPNFKNLGKAFKIASETVKSMDDWKNKKIQDMLKNDQPALIEVMVDETQGFSPKLSSRKLEDGTMISPVLEDMAPFLSRRELNKNIL